MSRPFALGGVAEQVSLFSIVMGIALLLVGIGCLVLSSSLLRAGNATTAARAA